VTYGAGSWESVGQLTLHRVRALYASWQRTPPVAVLVAAYLEYESPETKKGGTLADFLSDWAAAGGAIGG